MPQRSPVGVDSAPFDLAQLSNRHLRPLGELILAQTGFLPQPPDCPAQGDVLWFSRLSHSLREGTGAAGVATRAIGISSVTGALPDLAVAVGDFPHPAPGLGCVGDGEAGEESHGCLPIEVCDTG